MGVSSVSTVTRETPYSQSKCSEMGVGPGDHACAVLDLAQVAARLALFGKNNSVPDLLTAILLKSCSEGLAREGWAGRRAGGQ